MIPVDEDDIFAVLDEDDVEQILAWWSQLDGTESTPPV